MEITTTRLKRCALVEVSGRIDSGTAPELADALNTLTEDGIFNIVLDISAVDFISSAGLRVLIDVQKTCKHLNRGEMVLSGTPQRVHEAMDLAGFLPLFQFFDDKTTAVGSF